MLKRKLPNREERQLGLDPSKYIQTPFNAGNYKTSEQTPFNAGNYKTSEQTPLKKLRDQYDEANNNFKDPLQELRKAQEWFQRPEQKELARELDIEIQNGTPILSDEYAEMLEGPMNGKLSERHIKLLKLMTETR